MVRGSWAVGKRRTLYGENGNVSGFWNNVRIVSDRADNHGVCKINNGNSDMNNRAEYVSKREVLTLLASKKKRFWPREIENLDTYDIHGKPTKYSTKYIYSINSHIIHSSNCPYCQNIKKKNKRHFNTLGTAVNRQYRFCYYCHPDIHKMFVNEYDKIQSFAKSHNMKVRIKGDVIDVVTQYSRYKILLGKNNIPKLLHKNIFYDPAYKSEIRGYHDQKMSANTICDYLTIIADHDKFRKRHPVKVRKIK